MISKWAHKSMNFRNPSMFGKNPGTLSWQTCNAGLLLMLVILHDPGYLLTGNDGHTEVDLKTFFDIDSDGVHASWTSHSESHFVLDWFELCRCCSSGNRIMHWLSQHKQYASCRVFATFRD